MQGAGRGRGGRITWRTQWDCRFLLLQTCRQVQEGGGRRRRRFIWRSGRITHKATNTPPSVSNSCAQTDRPTPCWILDGHRQRNKNVIGFSPQALCSEISTQEVFVSVDFEVCIFEVTDYCVSPFLAIPSRNLFKVGCVFQNLFSDTFLILGLFFRHSNTTELFAVSLLSQCLPHPCFTF